MAYKFDASKFFPRRIMDAITEARVSRPEITVAAAARRKRRAQPAREGKLNMLACDHPARGVTGSLTNPLAMGNRQEYMGRVVRSLLCADFDGVMAQTDMIEDLLILDYLLQESGGPSLMDDRVVAEESSTSPARSRIDSQALPPSRSRQWGWTAGKC